MGRSFYNPHFTLLAAAELLCLIIIFLINKTILDIYVSIIRLSNGENALDTQTCSNDSNRDMITSFYKKQV